jgi:hypothetical protein
MLQIEEDRVKAQVEAVRAKCVELDKEHEGVELVKKFDEALDYAARYRDRELTGLSHNYLTPLDKWWDGESDLEPAHFNFWVSIHQPVWNAKPSFGMAMHYHSGQPQLGDSVEVNPDPAPHWSLHS